MWVFTERFNSETSYLAGEYQDAQDVFSFFEGLSQELWTEFLAVSSGQIMRFTWWHDLH